MTKLFDNTQFGDIFYTTENKRAVFLRFAENSEYNFAILYVEDWGTIQVFRGNGKEVHGEVAYDIIGKKEPSLPSDLDEAAEDCIQGLIPEAELPATTPFALEYVIEMLYKTFRAGAEWMAGQGWKEVSATDYPKLDKDKIYCVYTKGHYLLARVINHPNDEELFQWKCTEFPHTRYDMCEGDSYLEIRKKQ